MSFIGSVEQGVTYTPGFFLAHEECVRKTKTIAQANATTAANGSKYVKMGTVYPSNDQYAIGIVYEDVDVTTGDMPGSVVVGEAVVIESRLPVALDSDAKTALAAKGFTFVDEPAVTRPEYPATLEALTVNSIAGTAVGDTKVTVSGYEKKDTESYVYKVADAAETVNAGDVLAWTAWDGTADITAASGKKITVAVVTAAGEAVAAGNATVTANA